MMSILRTLSTPAFPLAAILLAVGSAWAQPRVAIVAAASSSNTAGQFTDPLAKLTGTGLFSAVDIIYAQTVTPTLAQLQQYDAIITWSNTDYANPVALGNVLADYVDAGGGVVVAIFATTNGSDTLRLRGRWETGGYPIMIPGPGTTTGGSHSLGAILIPGHPILEGVNTFHGGSQSWRPTSSQLAPHGIRVAEWTDGRNLIVTSSQFPNRVDLGMYPPSDVVVSTWWVSTTDGARLMANALLYTINTPPGCYPNCDGSSVPPILNVEDFTCFINEFAAAQLLSHEQQLGHYANCDASTTPPVLNVEDFTCFINQFAQGCR
jgi:hypothetical protein